MLAEEAFGLSVRSLDELGAAWAVVGGLAVSIHTEPRFTRDADFAVAVRSDAEAEAIVQELTRRSWTALNLVEQDAAGRLATVRLAPPGSLTAVVDLIFASCGIEPEIVGAATRLQVLPNMTSNVARIGHLIAMKTLAYRLQDRVDLVAMAAIAGDEEMEIAHLGIDLIAARGYDRGHDLRGRLDTLVEGSPLTDLP